MVTTMTLNFIMKIKNFENVTKVKEKKSSVLQYHSSVENLNFKGFI